LVGGMLYDSQKYECIQDHFASKRTGIKREEAKQRRQGWWQVVNALAPAYIAEAKPGPKFERKLNHLVRGRYCKAPASTRHPFGSLRIKENTYFYLDRAAVRARLARQVCKHPTWKPYVRVLTHMFYWIGDPVRFPEKLPACSRPPGTAPNTEPASPTPTSTSELVYGSSP
jgi:hypothetical protein